jgi:uncharacterized membrane protein (DUF4010 family)
VQRILKAGKLNEKVLKLFIATGKEEVISLVQALNIRHIVIPVLPTSELFYFVFMEYIVILFLEIIRVTQLVPQICEIAIFSPLN